MSTRTDQIPKLFVKWDDRRKRVSLLTIGRMPYDYCLATSKYSGKGKLYELIAQVVSSAPDLLAEIDRLRAENAELREALEAMTRFVEQTEYDDMHCVADTHIAQARAALAKGAR